MRRTCKFHLDISSPKIAQQSFEIGHITADCCQLFLLAIVPFGGFF
jgi:hypothetical protein